MVGLTAVQLAGRKAVHWAPRMAEQTVVLMVDEWAVRKVGRTADLLADVMADLKVVHWADL